MFDFIWHLRGSVQLRGSAYDESVLIRLEQLLDRQRKSPERGPSSLYFEAPLWEGPFMNGWRSMVLYDRGRFWIEQGIDGRKLRYDLRSLHAFVFCLFGGAMFFFFGFAAGGVAGALKWAVAAFCVGLRGEYFTGARASTVGHSERRAGPITNLAKAFRWFRRSACSNP